jgi:hypothetical protein
MKTRRQTLKGRTTPTLDDYYQMYKSAGYSKQMIESLISGLAESSLYSKSKGANRG